MKLRLLLTVFVSVVGLPIAASPAMAGTLRVSSFPSGAQVVINGVNTGKVTPMNVTLTNGSYTVAVQSPGPGWTGESTTVDVVDGNNDVVLTLAPTAAPGEPGFTGQNAVTAVGEGSGLTLVNDDNEVLLPGLILTIDVAENTVLYISSHGSMTNTVQDGPSDGFVRVVIDGQTASTPNGLRAYVYEAEFVRTANWSMSRAVELTPGTHTIEVRARANLGAPRFGGPAASAAANALTVVTLRR